jgi:hypothetical protein
MADSPVKTILGLAIAGVGAWWLYSSGLLSNLLGAPAAAPVPPVVPPAPAVPAGPCSLVGVLGPTLALAQKANPNKSLGPSGTDTFTMDEWNYYLNTFCTGLADQVKLDPGLVFPGRDDRGGPLNWNAWAGYAKSAGLSGARRRGVIGSHLVRVR